MSVCLDLAWTAINGGNISFRRAQSENIKLPERSARFANLAEWFEISAKPQWF